MTEGTTLATFRVEKDKWEAFTDKAGRGNASRWLKSFVDAVIDNRIDPTSLEIQSQDDTGVTPECLDTLIDKRIEEKLREMTAPMGKLQNPISEEIEGRLERLEEYCILDEGMVKEVALEARKTASRNEDAIINLDDKIFAVEESNKKLIATVEAIQANFRRDIEKLNQNLPSAETVPSQDKQDEQKSLFDDESPVEEDRSPYEATDATPPTKEKLTDKEMYERLGISRQALAQRRNKGDYPSGYEPITEGRRIFWVKA